ncbi:MAG: transketolase [Bacteriovoracaceae bacterium]|nr:transketolase [Bacteriovoracaceae bacterium]
MREVLSSSIVNAAKSCEDFILLTGDHGYALFDKLRKAREDQFLNVGIMEQALISMASGMQKTGFRTMCYGLSSFVPIRVLEQIKFDVCLPSVPVKIIGDGAGMVYTTLGNSHLCAEDVSCLLPLPHIEIYSPGDPEEMRICFEEFYNSKKPAYLRVGKCENPKVNTAPLSSTDSYFTYRPKSRVCFVSTGAMLGVVNNLAKKFSIDHLSIMKLKPMSNKVVEHLKDYDRLFIFEEHSRKGGLNSQLLDQFVVQDQRIPLIKSYSLKHSFIDKCGSYQYALYEHGLREDQLEESLKKYLA